MPSCDELLRMMSAQGDDQPSAPAAPGSSSMPLPRRIVVVGAGLKGLTVALELLRAFDAGRLRRAGGEPSIVVLERDDERYSRYGARHRAGGLIASTAVAARELLAHVPVEPPEPTPSGEFAPSVRIRPVPEGRACLDSFRPVRLALRRSSSGPAAALSPSNVPHNVAVCVDAMLDAGAAPSEVAGALDLWVEHMHQDVPVRWNLRDDCPKVGALLNPRTAFGRVQRALALACGGTGERRSAGFALMHAASFSGALWPAAHPRGETCPRLPGGVAASSTPEPPPAMWRCASVARDVLVPMRDLLRAHGVVVVHSADVAEVRPGGVRLRDGSERTADLVVDARAGDGAAAGGVLEMPECVARSYVARVAARGVTCMHPETPWQLVTTLEGGALDVRIGAVDSPGVRGARLRFATPAESAAEVLLQLGFGLADADSAAWSSGPFDGGPRGDEAPDVALPPREPRALLAFELGTPPVVLAVSSGVAAAAALGPVVRCRPQGASRHGPVRSLGPSFEAGKLTVHQLVQACVLTDPLASAGAGADILISVAGLELDADRRLLPEITAVQRWALFNHLAQRVGVGYAAYVTQAVVVAMLCAALVALVVVVPIVSVRRARLAAPPVPVTPPGVPLAAAATCSPATAPVAATAPRPPA